MGCLCQDHHARGIRWISRESKTSIERFKWLKQWILVVVAIDVVVGMETSLASTCSKNWLSDDEVEIHYQIHFCFLIVNLLLSLHDNDFLRLSIDVSVVRLTFALFFLAISIFCIMLSHFFLFTSHESLPSVVTFFLLFRSGYSFVFSFPSCVAIQKRRLYCQSTWDIYHFCNKDSLQQWAQLRFKSDANF